MTDAVALGVIALCALALHRDGLTGGPAFYELDTRLFYFPLAQWVGQQLHAGSFPLWLPDIFTGYPIFADGELGLAYLPQLLLLAALPTQVAMVWLRVLHVFLAGAFTFAYLRTLRLQPWAALGGALIFAFGSFLTVQMHHENVVRSAVWLPAVLLCIERGGVRWSALGALAFAQSALGLHVQPVLMSALAVGGYVLFRLVSRPWLPTVASGAAALGGGLALAAVQWLPLGEWALVSSRRGGVEYEFGSAFALPPVNLLSAIFPFFFRLPDATTWWSLWQQWEIELYVGIPTLSLVIVGVVLSRRAETVYFVLLALVSVWIAMAEYAPLVNLHRVLWSVPGFSFLRAPGRFIFLVVFACACLAALGLEGLADRHWRRLTALVGGVPPLAALVIMAIALPTWRAWLSTDPLRADDWVQATYLNTRAQYPIEPALAVSGFLSALDVANPKTGWSLVLLALTALAFLMWLMLGPRRVLFSQTVFVALLVTDLLVFAYDFHPRTRLESLATPLDLAAGQRVLLHDAVDLPQLEPDQLLGAGLATTGGYSSLPSQRHFEVEAFTSADPRLFDLWSAPFIFEPPHPSDERVVDGVRLRAQHPLVAGFGGSPAQNLTLPADLPSVNGLRIIGTLSYAFNAPQGLLVATITVGDHSLPLRAGIELSERAYDRPSLQGLLQHQKAAVALDFEEATREGEDYIAHLYIADLPLPPGVASSSITVTPTAPSVLVELFGVAAIEATGQTHSLDLASRQGMRRLSDQVIVDTTALPRAYVVPSEQTFSPGRNSTLTATQLVATPDFDPHTMALIENDPNAPQSPQGSMPMAAATNVQDLGPNAVRVTATADKASYVILSDFYHRGWTAQVDGQPTKVYIADALFRAVAIKRGTHVVEFRFEPLSHLVGLAVSLVSLIVTLLVIARAGHGMQTRRSRRT